MIPSDVQHEKKQRSRHLLPQIMLWGIIFCFSGFSLPTLAQTDRQVENFKITNKTLQSLLQEKVPQPLLEALNPLLNQLYTSKDAFLKVLANLQNPTPQPAQIDLILKHALLDNLWIDFEKAEMDFEKAESVLTGNVKGGIPKEDILFSADKVRVVTEGPQRYNKIIAENNVRVQQLGRDITTDRAIYNRATQKLDLVGNIVIKDKGITLYGTTAYLDRGEEKTEVRGDLNANRRVRVEYTLKGAGEPADAPDPPPSIIQAQRALLDNKQRQAIFEGNVEMTRPQLQLSLKAGKIVLVFNEARQLVSSSAEQDVCLEQPGRAARADKAQVSEVNQTIVLEGNAEINRGGIYLSGPVINLYLDVERGEAIGDSNTPVQMIIPLDDDSTEQAATPQRFTCQ